MDILKIFLYLLLYTVALSLILMLCSNMFLRAKQKKESAYIPFGNLYYLLKIGDAPTILIILFFIPIFNIVAGFIALYKVSINFKTSKSFYLGMVILPIIFLPLLSVDSKKYIYKKEEIEKQEELENVKDESYNLLSQDEFNKMNSEEVEEQKVDSTFKSEFDVMEKPDNYKAQRVNIDPNYRDLEVIEDNKIRRVKPVYNRTEKLLDEKPNKDDEDIEIVEL